VQLKGEAQLKGGFYVSPKAKLLFVVRICGINAMKSVREFVLQERLWKAEQAYTTNTDVPKAKAGMCTSRRDKAGQMTRSLQTWR
jgi:hypothetical protein